jgi:hypothetical protein
VAYTQRKTAIQNILLLVAMGITNGIRCWHRECCLISSYLPKVIKIFSEDIEQVTQSLQALYNQVDSLESVALQNRHELDLLTAEKGRTCLFLHEECCFYTNKSGVVRDMPNN